MVIPAQDTEPLTPEVIDAIQQLVAETSINTLPILLSLFGSQAVMVGAVFAAVKWLKRRDVKEREAAEPQRAHDKAEAADQRAEDRRATDARFREVVVWLRWLVFLQISKNGSTPVHPPGGVHLPDFRNLPGESNPSHTT